MQKGGKRPGAGRKPIDGIDVKVRLPFSMVSALNSTAKGNTLAEKVRSLLNTQICEKEINVVDFFCGAGGLSLGFQKAGFSIKLGVDIDKAALVTYEKNHHAKTLCCDIRKLTGEIVKKEIGGANIDVIIGGPPCQGFSIAGKRSEDDPRNQLYLSFIRLVNEIKPKVFVIENVPGILSYQKGLVKDNIIKKFESFGYSVSYKVLTASQYGVPQTRKRVLFVGTLTKQQFVFPRPGNSLVSCKMALSDLPPLINERGIDPSDYYLPPQNDYQKLMRKSSNKVHNHIAAKHSERIQTIISLVPPGGNYKDLPESIKNTTHFHVAFTRFPDDKPAPTIDTGHRHHYHYKYNRVPTVRECARIQSFPDDFIFFGNKTEQFRQVGNAVPPLLAECVAKKIKEEFFKDE